MNPDGVIRPGDLTVIDCFMGRTVGIYLGSTPDDPERPCAWVHVFYSEGDILKRYLADPLIYESGAFLVVARYEDAL